jgi:hypothetical protein
VLGESLQEVNLPQRPGESHPGVAEDKIVTKIAFQAAQIAIARVEAEPKRVLPEELYRAVQQIEGQLVQARDNHQKEALPTHRERKSGKDCPEPQQAQRCRTHEVTTT